MKILNFTLIFLCLSIGLNAQVSQEKVDAFNQYVEESRKHFEVPGCAIAVVKDGKVVMMEAYGETALNSGQEVNLETLFGIMSTTKAITALGMGILVDKGLVSWDDKVLQYLPEFQLYDSYVSRELRVRDLFTHNAGLGNADFLWAYDAKMDQDEILHRMRWAKPAYSFRAGYTYQNIMYLAAGKVIERVSGMSWERFTKEAIFQKLGMSNTFPNMAYSAQYKNRSKAHYKVDGEIIEIEEMSADPIAPAGATWSTIEDMSKWVQFLLNEGKVGDQQIIKSGTLAEILKPQAIIPQNQFYPTTRLTKPKWTTYGLGWFQQDYRGEFVAFHTGSLAGRTAIIGLIPEHDFGVYFFGNLDHAELRHAMMLKAFDVFVFDDNSRDWSAEIKAMYDGFNTPTESTASPQVKGTKPSHDLETYVGDYSDPFWGKVKVSYDNKQLHFHLSDANVGRLEHWHYNVFKIKWSKKYWGDSVLEFKLNPVDAKVNGLSFDGAAFTKE